MVVHRLPSMLRFQWQCHERHSLETTGQRPANLIHPRSHCPHCSAVIKARHNIPLISYAILRAKCAACQHPISIRYPIVELLTAMITIYAGFTFGPSIALPFSLLYCWLMITLCFIDIKTQLLPDNLTLPLLWLGIMANYSALFTTLESAVLGAILGYLFFWSIYQIHRLLTGKQGMGYGDFKLIAAIGAWVGWELLPMVIFLSSIGGLLFGLVAILLKHYHYNSPIPFGPFLTGAGLITLFGGDTSFYRYYQIIDFIQSSMWY